MKVSITPQSNPEPTALPIDKIDTLYQRAFTLLNERIFNNELPPIEISYFKENEVPKDMPDLRNDCEAVFCYYVENGIICKDEPPIIFLNVQDSPEFGIGEDEINHLFHELIHYYCYLHDIPDTESDYTFHNKQFKSTVEKFGGFCDYLGSDVGYSYTELPGNILSDILKDL